MARPLRIEYPGAYYHVMNRDETRNGRHNLSRPAQLGGHKHEEIGKTVGLGKASSVSSAYLLMKERVAKENQLQQRVRKIEEALTPNCCPGWTSLNTAPIPHIHTDPQLYRFFV